MTTTKAKKLKKTAAARVPQNRDDVAADIKRIGDLQRQQQELVRVMNDALANITHEAQPRIDELGAQIDALQTGVQTWCEANRDELTHGGKTKTADFITGTVSWRQRPPSVSVRGVEVVLETLRRMGLARFIRTKEEVNKEAVLNEPDAVRGVAGLTVKTGIEDFAIAPFEVDVKGGAA